MESPKFFRKSSKKKKDKEDKEEGGLFRRFYSHRSKKFKVTDKTASGSIVRDATGRHPIRFKRSASQTSEQNQNVRLQSYKTVSSPDPVEKPRPFSYHEGIGHRSASQVHGGQYDRPMSTHFTDNSDEDEPSLSSSRSEGSFYMSDSSGGIHVTFPEKEDSVDSLPWMKEDGVDSSPRMKEDVVDASPRMDYDHRRQYQHEEDLENLVEKDTGDARPAKEKEREDVAYTNQAQENVEPENKLQGVEKVASGDAVMSSETGNGNVGQTSVSVEETLPYPKQITPEDIKEVNADVTIRLAAPGKALEEHCAQMDLVDHASAIHDPADGSVAYTTKYAMESNIAEISVTATLKISVADDGKGKEYEVLQEILNDGETKIELVMGREQSRGMEIDGLEDDDDAQNPHRPSQVMNCPDKEVSERNMSEQAIDEGSNMEQDRETYTLTLLDSDNVQTTETMENRQENLSDGEQRGNEQSEEVQGSKETRGEENDTQASHSDEVDAHDPRHDNGGLSHDPTLDSADGMLSVVDIDSTSQPSMAKHMPAAATIISDASPISSDPTNPVSVDPASGDPSLIQLKPDKAQEPLTKPQQQQAEKGGVLTCLLYNTAPDPVRDTVETIVGLEGIGKAECSQDPTKDLDNDPDSVKSNLCEDINALSPCNDEQNVKESVTEDSEVDKEKVDKEMDPAQRMDQSAEYLDTEMDKCQKEENLAHDRHEGSEDGKGVGELEAEGRLMEEEKEAVGGANDPDDASKTVQKDEKVNELEVVEAQEQINDNMEREENDGDDGDEEGNENSEDAPEKDEKDTTVSQNINGIKDSPLEEENMQTEDVKTGDEIDDKTSDEIDEKEAKEQNEENQEDTAETKTTEEIPVVSTEGVQEDTVTVEPNTNSDTSEDISVVEVSENVDKPNKESPMEVEVKREENDYECVETSDNILSRQYAVDEDVTDDAFSAEAVRDLMEDSISPACEPAYGSQVSDNSYYECQSIMSVSSVDGSGQTPEDDNESVFGSQSPVRSERAVDVPMSQAIPPPLPPRNLMKLAKPDKKAKKKKESKESVSSAESDLSAAHNKNYMYEKSTRKSSRKPLKHIKRR